MKKLYGLLLMTVASTPAAMAQNLTDEQVDSINRSFDLHNVVVTGTRTPKLLKDTPIQTRLITSEEIRNTDATHLQDLLQQELPGVEFSYAMNQQVNMNFAGFAGQGVLILIDGERLAGETMENTDFARLDMSQVERIEIVKGAASAIYGSNATGGVINIITKESRKPWAVNLNARLADHHEQRYGGSVSFAHKGVSNTLTVAHTKIDSYDVCHNTKDHCDFRTVYGGKTWNFKDQLVYRPVDNLKLTARAGYFFRERLYNVDTPDRYRDFSGGVRGEWGITDRDHLELSYAYDQYDKSDFVRQFKKDVRDYSNVQHSVRSLYTRTLRESDALTLGGDFMRDYLASYQFHAGETHDQVTADLFAQYDWIINPHWEVVGAARWDYFSDGDDSQLTGKLGFRYTTGHLTIRGGYAGGFRAPTLKEKYMDFDMSGIFDIHGNKDLEAEKSHNFNASAEYSYKNYDFTIGGNYNHISNKISTSAVMYDENDDPFIRYMNVGKLKVYGFEANAKAHWRNGISVSLGYNYTHEESYSNTATQYCPARPHAFNCKFDWSHRWKRNYKTSLTVTGRVLSKVSYTSMYMYEPFEQYRVTNPAYTLWKIQLAQHIYRGCRLNIAVDNIFNYSPKVYSFNSPTTLGTNLMVGLNLDLEKFFK